MYLSRIKIRNFRKLKDVDLTLNKGLNLVVGENNSGKTALIDAVRYTLDTNSAEWIRISENDFYKDTTHFSIQLKFDGITPGQASVFVEHLTHEPIGDGEKRKSVLYVNLEARLTDQLHRGYRFIKTEIRSGQNADGPAIEREIRNYLSTTYLKPLRDAEAELASGRGSRLSRILSESDELVKKQDRVESLIQALIDANNSIITNQGVIKNREIIEKLLKKLIFETDQFKPAIEIVGHKKEISKMSVTEKKQTFRAILEKLSLSLDENSPLQGLGYNNILFIATELLLLEGGKDEFPLLLIEEPEAHLHPQLQMKLLKFIREESSPVDNPKLQAILTTHSPNLSSKAPLESIIIMHDGKPYPPRKCETELSDDDYEFLEKFLDVTKANLFFAKAVLMVEGYGENILIPTIAGLLGRPLENYGVSIVNVGNTAFSRYAKIFKRKGLDAVEHMDKWLPVKVACLRDLDLWPDKAEKPFGWKDKTQGNSKFWKSNYSVTELKKFENKKKSIEGQYVKVCLSDTWTFEYSLAFNGLAEEVYETVTGNKTGFNDLPVDEEERTISIYKRIEEGNAKTKVAYNLVKILTKNYQGEAQKKLLKSKLPQYIIDAIEHVTEPLKPSSGEIKSDQQRDATSV